MSVSNSLSGGVRELNKAAAVGDPTRMAQTRALVFVAVMSLVAEPARRRTLNAIILAGATGVYLSGG